MDLLDEHNKKMQEALKQESKQGLKESLQHKQLSFWPTDVRVTPNEIARSSLFHLSNKRERKFFKSLEVFNLANSCIEYTGEELRMDDQDLWLEIIHLFRQKEIKSSIKISACELIKRVGWSGKNRRTGELYNPSKKHYDRLEKALTRFKANEIKIKNSRLDSLGLSMISKYSKINGMLVITLEPEVILLFKETYTTYLSVDLYRELKPIEKKLYQYYSSSKVPYDVTLDSIFKLVGSETKTKSKFKSMINQALKKLVEIGFLESAEINKNLVCVKKSKNFLKKAIQL